MGEVLEVIGPVTLKDGWSLSDLRRWLEYRFQPKYPSMRSIQVIDGFFQGNERLLPYFDILATIHSLSVFVRGAVVYQDGKGRWWIDEFAGNFGKEIFETLVKDGIAVIEQPKPVKVEIKPIIERVEVDDYTPKHRVTKSKFRNPKPIERVRGSIYPPTTIPKKWLEPRKRRNQYLDSKGHYVEYGEIDYCDDFELSQIREKLEARHYSFVA